MVGIIIVYIILGCMMDAMAMIVLTIPFIYPIVINLGFDPIWFGIIIVVMCEMGLITPPVGMNLFMLSGVSGIDLVTIIKGVWPFVLAMIVCTAILLLFPQIALLLPGFMHY
jgi:TRAP-type C4-dicarboxylate transport system permease large subunit